MSQAVQGVRDDEFITGVMSRRVVAWLIDLLLICLLLVLLWLALFVFAPSLLLVCSFAF